MENFTCAEIPPVSGKIVPGDAFLAPAGRVTLLFTEFEIGRSFAPVFPMLDGLSDRIERYMDLLSARQRLVAANIANADTPGYHTRDVDFQSTFESQMHGMKPAAREVPGLPVKNDGNNVNLDREARMLAENALRFNIASNLLRSQIRMVRSAIEEGKSG